MSRGSEVMLSHGSAGPQRPAYACIPEGARRGMVVVHEIFGRAPEIDGVVDRFASLGYAAVAPDLFTGRLKPLCIASAMRQIHAGAGPLIDEIRHAGEWLRQQARLEASQVGIIGFCLGGGFALACGSGYGAVSTNYGEVPQLPDDLGPTIGCYGGLDRAYRGKAKTLETKLKQRGIAHEVRVYPDAGHAFLTHGHHPVATLLSKGLLNVTWNPATAEDAWGHILAFFDQHLGAAAIQEAL